MPNSNLPPAPASDPTLTPPAQAAAPVADELDTTELMAQMDELLTALEADKENLSALFTDYAAQQAPELAAELTPDEFAALCAAFIELWDGFCGTFNERAAQVEQLEGEITNRNTRRAYRDARDEFLAANQGADFNKIIDHYNMDMTERDRAALEGLTPAEQIAAIYAAQQARNAPPAAPAQMQGTPMAVGGADTIKPQRIFNRD